MSFLGIGGKTFLVIGIANRKSVAYHVAKILSDEGARIVLSVRDEATAKTAAQLFPGVETFVCDVERQADIDRLAHDLRTRGVVLDGMLHSLAFADYSGGLKPFHETSRADFLRAADISCFSLIALARSLADLFVAGASVVTVSISTTRMAAENYGYMAPIKAALDSSVCFLAKSFAAQQLRFNAINPGLLKTSASAGIPGYVDSYLFAEKLTLRKRAVRTDEAAAAAAFLLSGRSSGINAQTLVIDAGMSVNYFDAEIVKKTVGGQG